MAKHPQDNLAAKAQALSLAMSAFVEAWTEADEDDGISHPMFIAGYPFEASLDELSADVSAFAQRAETWAHEVARARAEHLAAQEALADEHGLEYDPDGPDLSACGECGALYQFIGDEPGQHLCHAIRCESVAAERADQ